MDSADVWANPTQFYLDKDLNPIEVAGCPPDASQLTDSFGAILFSDGML